MLNDISGLRYYIKDDNFNMGHNNRYRFNRNFLWKKSEIRALLFKIKDFMDYSTSSNFMLGSPIPLTENSDISQIVFVPPKNDILWNDVSYHIYDSIYDLSRIKE